MSRSLETLSPAEFDTAMEWVLRSEAGMTGAEHAEFERWQTADPSHCVALANARRAWLALDRPRLAGRGHEMAGALRARTTRRHRRRVAIGAVALLAVLISVLPWNSRRETDAWPQTARLIVPEKRTLPDGSVVELRPGADLAVDYSAQFRRVSLRAGEALFVVAKDRARPFMVTTGNVEVRAVGTAFAVAKLTSQIDVIVTEGTVAVDRIPGESLPAAAPANSGEATHIRAGYASRVDLAARAAVPTVTAVSEAEIAARLDWRTPRVAFTNAPLADAVAIMNKHSRLRLVIEEPALRGIPVNGVFRLGNAETMVRLLETGFGIQAQRTEETITLRKTR